MLRRVQKYNTLVLLVLLAFILGSSGCTKVNREEVSMQLLTADRAFAQMSKDEGAAEAFRQYLTEDALQLPNGGHVITGRDSIYAVMQQGQEVTLDWEPHQAVVAKSGELGYTWGTYTASWTTGDRSVKTSYGKYLNIWRKQDDGQWKVTVDMGNQNPAPTSSMD